MKKINWNFIITTCIICLMPICMGLYFYNELPDTMAIHFNIENQADNFASKNFTIFVLPIFMSLLQAFACIVNDIRVTSDNKFIKVMKWFIPVLTIVIYTLTILFSLGKVVDIGKIISIVLGIMFIIMGNYLPKMTYEDAKGNMHLLPTNEENFRKMIRLLGYTFVVGGIALIAAIFITNKVAFFTILGLCLIVLIENMYFYIKRK